MSQNLETVKHGPAESGVEDLLLKRWSPRAFSEQPVSNEDLKKLFTAAAWAASSYNEQPWRFIIGRSGDTTYSRIFDTLVAPNQGWAKTAPVLILSVAKNTFSQNEAPNRFALHDTGAASANLALEATALGLHVHGMGGFDPVKARAAFEIPTTFEIGAVWALGYAGDPDALPETLKNMELAPRKRHSLADFVFEAWDKPAAL